MSNPIVYKESWFKFTYLLGRSVKFSIQYSVFSIQFSLFPAHINMSYNNDYVHIMCRKRGGLKTVLMNVHPQTLTLVNYEHNYYCLLAEQQPVGR